jgi:thioredoxin reductase
MIAELPIVVIGAGPVGLAAAAHLLERGLAPQVFEAGARVGSGMLAWSHVRMFSPWHYSIDHASRRLLERNGWQAPDPDGFPTGQEVVAQYLAPLAATPPLQPRIHTGRRVTAVTKLRRDRMKDMRRDDAPFLVRYEDADGEHEIVARAVIDASGTIESPNPLGASGIPARGEKSLRPHIFYGMPDVLGVHRSRYAGKRVLVVGSGHSAFNVLNDLAVLATQEAPTRVLWALRRDSIEGVLGGGESDQLAERGKLGSTIGRLVASGALHAATSFELEALEATPDGIVAHGARGALPAVDEIVATTGFRPNLQLLAELRLSIDAGTESPTALAPLIDPNLHSCGSVRPHGAEELKHPDAGIYIVGMKSYGRAPTFLLLTGYEQVRSVVAAIDGDWDAARRVELVLPETGVCITQSTGAAITAPASACCSSTPVVDDASSGAPTFDTATPAARITDRTRCGGRNPSHDTNAGGCGTTMAGPAQACAS